MSANAPFATRPCKPAAARLPDGRIGIFVGGETQFTDDAGARHFRDQLDQVLGMPASMQAVDAAPIRPEHLNTDDEAECLCMGIAKR